MRRKGFVLLAGLALVGLPSVVSAQVLHATPIDAGIVMLAGADTTANLQFTVEVSGRAPRSAGGADDHFLTFSQPVQVPGAALDAGTYVFRLITPSVMQVRSVDRKRSLLFMVKPVERTHASPDYDIVLRHEDAREPARVTGLFLPHTANGYRPLYGAPTKCERILQDLHLPTNACFG